MAAPQGEVVLLEAVEAAAHTAAQPDSARDRTRSREDGVAEPQRLLADERKLHRAAGTEQPLVGEPRRPRYANIVDQDPLRARSPSLIGTAGYGAVCPVVWDPWLTNQSVAGTRFAVGLLNGIGAHSGEGEAGIIYYLNGHIPYLFG